MKKVIAIGLLSFFVSQVARGEGPLLVTPEKQADSSDQAAVTSDLQKVGAAAAEKIAGGNVGRFRLSLLDKAAEAPFPDIDCQDGADLMFRWNIKSAEEVTNQHIDNAAAFSQWYKSTCGNAEVAP